MGTVPKRSFVNLCIWPTQDCSCHYSSVLITWWSKGFAAEWNEKRYPSSTMTSIATTFHVDGHLRASTKDRREMKKDTSVAITTFPTDGSLPPQHMTEGGSTKDRQEKCLALHRRQEAYKFFFADISQISDGRSLEMIRRNSCPPLVVISKTKTLPQAKKYRGRPPARLSMTTTRMDSESKGGSGSSRRRSVDSPRVSSAYKYRQSEAAASLGCDGTACASESQLSVIGRRFSDTSDVTMEFVLNKNIGPFANRNQNEKWPLVLDGRHAIGDHDIAKDEDTSHDPANLLLSLAMNYPTLYSKLALKFAASCPNLSAKVASETNLIIRKKHHPLHRCPSTNGMVMGIVKPSRYSQGCSLKASSSTTDLTHLPGYNTQLKESEETNSKTIGRTTSLLSVLDRCTTSSLSMHSNTTQSKSSTHSKPACTDSWIPPGVIFNPSIEIYEFRKTIERDESLDDSDESSYLSDNCDEPTYF